MSSERKMFQGVPGPIDQPARDAATEALHRIEKHEDVCAIRYEALDTRLASGADRMKTISDDVKGIKDDIKAGVLRLILSLFGAVGTMGAALFAILRHGAT
jgi:hypothetical protein